MKLSNINVQPTDQQRAEIDKKRQAFKLKRMKETGIGIFWTPELAARKGPLQVEDASAWQTKRTYKGRNKLILPSRLNNLRDVYGTDILAVSMRGAETWRLRIPNEDGAAPVEYIFKQDPRTDSYEYEKAALLRIREQYKGLLEQERFPLLVDYDDEQQILITSYMEGPVLSELDPHLLSQDEKAEWIRGIVSVIRNLHDIGIAHFDLAPRKFKYRRDGTVGLIDYGSCGIGNTITMVQIGHLRNTKNPEGPRFHRAPELTHTYIVDGQRAELYGVARLIYWLHFETAEPLIEAARETGFSIDTAKLGILTRRLKHYSREDDELLAELLLAFAELPEARKTSLTRLLEVSLERYERMPIVKSSSPLLMVEAYTAKLEKLSSGRECILFDCDHTLFSVNVHDYALVAGRLAANKDRAADAYALYRKDGRWKYIRRSLYRYAASDPSGTPFGDNTLRAIGKQVGTDLYAQKKHVDKLFSLMKDQAAQGAAIVIVTGSPTALVEGITDSLFEIYGIAKDARFVFGTEYDYHEDHVDVVIEGYGHTKRGVAQELTRRGAKLIWGCGDNLRNDTFLIEVAAAGGRVLLVD